MSTEGENQKSVANTLAVMNRREALTRIALLMGGTLIASDVFIYGTRLEGKTITPSLTPDDLALMDEIGETIIPTTNTPGAKAAGVSAIIAVLVADCYDDAHQKLFVEGLKNIEASSQQRFQKSFLAATSAQRTELLNTLDAEQRLAHQQNPKGQLPHSFRLIKELVLVGYFTSEIGANQALRYVEVPGRYDGNTSYKKGDPAWFVNPSRNLA